MREYGCSGTLLITVLLLLVVVMARDMAAPQVSLDRASERVPRRTLQYFWVSMVATIALICVFSFHIFSIFDTRAVDRNLSRLTTAIERNLQDEINLALMKVAGRRRRTSKSRTSSRIC